MTKSCLFSDPVMLAATRIVNLSFDNLPPIHFSFLKQSVLLGRSLKKEGAFVGVENVFIRITSTQIRPDITNPIGTNFGIYMAPASPEINLKLILCLCLNRCIHEEEHSKFSKWSFLAKISAFACKTGPLRGIR